MSARVWRIASPMILVATALCASESRTVSAFEPAATPRVPNEIENAAIRGPERIDPARLIEDPEVAALFAHLFQLAGSGLHDLERAAFLVREPDRSWSCLLWPSKAGFRTEQFRGTIPEGVVAILHTHPNRMTRASGQDNRTAVSTGLPLFTITRVNVTVIDERSGKETWAARNLDWRRAIPASYREDCRCREIGPDARPRREGLLAGAGR